MPGESDEEDLNGELPPLELTVGQEAAWRRIVARARREIGAAEDDRYATHLELRLGAPAMQLWYSGRSISIEVPYWYTATEAGAHRAIATAYALARIVEAETGMRGVDHEVDQAVRDDGLLRAVARYRWNGAQARALADGQATPARPDPRTDAGGS